MLSFVVFTKIYCVILKSQILLFRAKINKRGILWIIQIYLTINQHFMLVGYKNKKQPLSPLNFQWLFFITIIVKGQSLDYLLIQLNYNITVTPCQCFGKAFCYPIGIISLNTAVIFLLILRSRWSEPKYQCIY